MYRNLKREKLENKLIKREYYIDLLLKNLNKNKLIIGKPYVGKTTLLKEIVSKKDSIVYIDTKRLGLSPEAFSVEFIETVASYHKGKGVELDDCRIKESTSLIVDKVKNELEKIKPDQQLLVELAFTYAEELGKEVGKEFTLCLDEFWKLLDMNNFSKIDIVEIFRKVSSSQSRTHYFLVSSYNELGKEINKELKFELVEILPLTLRECGDDDLYYYSQGMPLFLNSIKDKDVRNKFLRESLTKTGIIYNACYKQLNEALDKARGKTLLVEILKALCDNDGLRLNEISRKIYRSASVTKNLITRLINVDLLVKEGNLFLFKDSVLKFWFRNYVQENDFDIEPGKDVMKKIEVDL